MTGLYIHLPFCQRKCLYCDFPSFENMYDREDAYTEALLYEMKRFSGTTVDTVYLGGGTPSSLSEASLSRILRGVHSFFRLTTDAEITAEVNPASALRPKLTCLKDGGVSRLSVGVQSLNDRELSALGRLHNREEALETIALAKSIGYRSVSVDLMLAIPYQTLDSLASTISDLLALRPDHISAYSLIVEPGTPFSRMRLDLPDEVPEREMYWYTVRRLENEGYRQYEISNFSKPGHESRHNLKYWSGDSYIGIGAGAHSFLNSVRYSHKASIDEYIDHPLFRDHIDYISPEEGLRESFLLGLRKCSGITYHGEFRPIIERHIQNGLLEFRGNILRLTERGIDLANQVWMDFV